MVCTRAAASCRPAAAKSSSASTHRSPRIRRRPASARMPSPAPRTSTSAGGLRSMKSRPVQGSAAMSRNGAQRSTSATTGATISRTMRFMRGCRRRSRTRARRNRRARCRLAPRSGSRARRRAQVTAASMRMRVSASQRKTRCARSGVASPTTGSRTDAMAACMLGGPAVSVLLPRRRQECPAARRIGQREITLRALRSAPPSSRWNAMPAGAASAVVKSCVPVQSNSAAKPFPSPCDIASG